MLIEKYAVECNDPNEECDLDLICLYAMPDGTTKEEKITVFSSKESIMSSIFNLSKNGFLKYAVNPSNSHSRK